MASPAFSSSWNRWSTDLRVLLGLEREGKAISRILMNSALMMDLWRDASWQLRLLISVPLKLMKESAMSSKRGTKTPSGGQARCEKFEP